MDAPGQSRCHTHSVSKGVILWNTIPYTLVMQKHCAWADSARGMQRSKVRKAESSMIEKEVAELKYKDFVIALYFMSMHSNKAKGQAHLLNHLFTVENSTSVGCTCTQAETNLDNYMSVIYDAWSLEIWKNNIMCEIIKRTSGIA